MIAKSLGGFLIFLSQLRKVVNKLPQRRVSRKKRAQHRFHHSHDTQRSVDRPVPSRHVESFPHPRT